METIDEKPKVKGFEKAVKRMKDKAKADEELQKKLEKELRGERYTKKKLDNFEPPSMLERERIKSIVK